MPKLSRKQLRSLEVSIMFEPNRFEQASLQAAYTCLLPMLQRKMNSVEKRPPGHAGQSLQPAEGNAL